MSRCRCNEPERNENWNLSGCEELRKLKEALQRIATERFPMPTPCRETYLRNIAKKALEI